MASAFRKVKDMILKEAINKRRERDAETLSSSGSAKV